MKQYYCKPFLFSNFENGLFHLSLAKVMYRMEEGSMPILFYTTITPSIMLLSHPPVLYNLILKI